MDFSITKHSNFLNILVFIIIILQIIIKFIIKLKKAQIANNGTAVSNYETLIAPITEHLLQD